MKRTEFKEFYQASLVPELERIDKLRKSVLAQLTIVFSVVGIAFPLFAYFVITIVESISTIFYFIPIFILLATGCYMVFESIIKNTPFYRDYKKDVIYRIIKFINPTLRYDKKHFISQKEYFNSGFFPKYPVTVEGDDHVAGSVDDVSLEFSELVVTYKKSMDKKEYNSEFQFRGIFFVAKTPKTFPADIIIEPKGFTREGDVNIVAVDHEEFNRSFQVRVPTNDYLPQVKEMLTKEFLDKIVSFNNLTHNEVHISFIYDKLYVAIKHDKDLFEPSVWHSIVNFDMVNIHYQDLYYPLQIIEHFAAYKEFELNKVTQADEASAN